MKGMGRGRLRDVARRDAFQVFLVEATPNV